MSKTNSAVLWLEAEIIRLKRELAEHELARNIMMRFEEKPATKLLTMDERGGATAEEKKAVAGFILNRRDPVMVGPHSVLPVGMGQRERLILKTIGTGSMTSGEVIRKIGCKTKQDKQMVYVALSALKRQRILHQDEATRQYSDAQS